jgi:hypothetical protein
MTFGMFVGARKAAALVAAAAWLLGVEIAPAVHVARHGDLAPHTHRHGAARHAHAARPELEETEPDADHGEGSLEHHGVAVLAPAAVVPPIPSAHAVRISIAQLEPSSPALASRERPTARGPPTS